MNFPSRQLVTGCAAWLAAGVLLASLAPGADADQPPRAEILTSMQHAVTPALRNFVPAQHARPNAPFRVFPLRHPLPIQANPNASNHPGNGGGGGNHGGGHGGGSSTWTDADLVAPLGQVEGSVGSVFQGISANGSIPPDPNLAVGSTQIVQIINVEFAVWEKPAFGGSATQVLAPAPIHTIFASLPSSSPCAKSDGGDPIVLWDQFDQRWLISQLAYNSSLSNDHWCLAISNSADATGTYSVYDFSFGSSFPDYPKIGIWNAGAASQNSGVYFSANIFAHGSRFTGAEACAFSLSAVRSPPSTLSMACYQPGSGVYSILPANVNGTNLAPNEGGLYLQFDASGGSGSSLSLYQFSPDFTTPANSAFSLLRSIPVNTYHEACGGGTCIPQPQTKQALDSLGDRLMYQLAFRNEGNGTNSLFVNQSVQVSSTSNQTGIRWYEIDNPTSSNPTVIQGTYAPDSSNYRWMGSVAQDRYGDIGLGYSVSSSSMFPAVAFTGRTPSDTPANALDLPTTIWTGSGSQTGYSRWGDYSGLALDPSDDCTFWYTNEYLPYSGSFNWNTVIASFRFPSCTQ